MKKYQLKSLIDVKRGASLAGEYYSNEGSLVRLTLGNFKEEGGFKFNTSKENLYYTGPVKDEYILKKGDIITPLTEQVIGLLGATARIPESDKYVQSGDVALIKSISDELYEGYCYYLISSDVVRKQLSAAAQQTKIRHTSPEKIKNCQVFLPDVSTQIKISNFLDAIDKKISLNVAINDNLSHLINDLYYYWFVQFNYPTKEGKPYRSSGGKMVWNEKLNISIPEGWTVAPLKGLYSIKRGISYASDDIAIDNETNEKKVPMINLACIDRNRNYRDGKLKYLNSKIPDSMILNPEELLIACTDLTREREIIGCPILVPCDGVKYTYSMDIAKIAFSNTELNDLYMYMALRTDFYHNYIKKWASGTNVLHLNLEGLDWYTMAIPPISLQNKFAEYVRNIHRMQGKILSENRNLSSLRDFCLPMLLNGQIAITK